MSRQNGVGDTMRAISSVDPIDPLDQTLQAALDRSASGMPLDPLLRELGDARDEIAAAVATATLLRGASLPALPDARRLALRDDIVRMEARAVAVGPSPAGSVRTTRGAAVIGLAIVGLAGLIVLWNRVPPAPAATGMSIGSRKEHGPSHGAGDDGRAGATAVVRHVIPRMRSATIAMADQGSQPAASAVRATSSALAVGSDTRRAPAQAPAATIATVPTPVSSAQPVRDRRDRRQVDPGPSPTIGHPTTMRTPVATVTPTTSISATAIATPTGTISPVAAAAGIAGRITDLAGASLEAALVKAESVDGAGLAVWVRSAADGTYRLDVPPGAYRVGCEIEGYETLWYAGRARPEDADPVVVAADQRTGGIDFALPPATEP